jgi:hypothetical protein
VYSQSGIEEKFRRKYATPLASAIPVGALTFVAILSSPQYANDPVTRVASGIGALIFFGGSVFVIGYVVVKLKARRATVRSVIAPNRRDSRPFPARRTLQSERSKPGMTIETSSVELAQLHPVVGAAAAPHWPYGNYTSAVGDAARAVNSAIQCKVGDFRYSECALTDRLFSTNDPKVGDARLAFPGNRTSPTTRSRTRGAYGLATACFSGIRNVAAHEHEVAWSRGASFEYLAMFSALMRWVDECHVERF